MGGWMHGWIEAAGQDAEKKTLLDIEEKKNRYNDTIKALTSLVDSPNTPWEEKTRLYSRVADLRAKGWNRVKDKDLDISDAFITSQKRTPKPAEVDVERIQKGEDKTFPVGTPKFLPSGAPAFFEKTPPSYLQYEKTDTPGYEGPTQFTPYEQAMMDAERQAAAWQYTAPWKREAKGGAPKRVGRTFRTSGDDLIRDGITTITGITGDPVPVIKGETYEVTEYDDRSYEIQGPIELPVVGAGLGYQDGQARRLVRQGNQLSAMTTPEGVQIDAPTDEHILTMDHPTAYGKTAFVSYKTYKGSNTPVLNSKGEIDLAYTDPPSSWISNTREGQTWLQTGGGHAPFKTIHTSNPNLPAPIFTFDRKRGRMTLNGVPVNIMGVPVKYNYVPPGGTPQPAAPAAQPGIPPPPGMETPAPTIQGMSGEASPSFPTQPLNLPDVRDGKGAMAAIRKKGPVYIASTDASYINRTRIDYNNFWLSKEALNSEDPNTIKSNPFLKLDLNTNPFLSAAYRPEAVAAVPDPTDPTGTQAMIVDAQPGGIQQELASTSSIAHDPTKESFVPNTLKPLTTFQMGTFQNHYNAMGTTAHLLTELLSADMVNFLVDKKGNTRFWNAVQVGVAEMGKAGALLTNVMTSLKQKLGLKSAKEINALTKMIALRSGMTEHVQTIRTPLGAAGFRSLEAFNALQKQFGNPFMPPQVMFAIMRNTLRTVLTIQASYGEYLNLSKQGTLHPTTRQPMAGPNYPDDVTQDRYLKAYGTAKEAIAAMLRDGYLEPPDEPNKKR